MAEDALTVEVDFSEWDELAGVVVDQDVHGCLIVEQHPDGMGRVGLLYRPGLPVDVLRMLGEWALQRVGRFLEHGPEPDGWQRRSDGAWQLWGRLVDLPEPD
ncbi:hypothetical protein [Micromonospora sp. NPDC005367]|uniref:hypothetical protein n=1 Tax=Micromonospora sp. NPDC005367 TaxID=3155590 RepID=UPI0033A128E1